MSTTDPYLSEVWAALPRLLAMYDNDETSPTFGLGDRRRWAWRLVDFGTGTFQGAARGLASLVTAQQLPPTVGELSVLRRIESMFIGAQALRRRNGSLEEAFAYESSFCVTAAVAFDLLTAIETLGDRTDDATRAARLEIVAPMIRFLLRTDEHHGLISNHLLAATAALVKWTQLTGEDGAHRGEFFLARTLREQSSEGWLREYQGADAGYQTLALGYLADVHRLRPDLGLGEPARGAVDFLKYCAHPDGSFGGIYGSRNTRFYFPDGVEALASELPAAAALAAHMRRAISRRGTVTLAAMDDLNLVPMFNAYAVAAATSCAMSPTEPLPFADTSFSRRVFPGAGLIVDRGPDSYTIVSLHKGGVCCAFALDGSERTIDAGVLMTDASGQRVSTQAYNSENVVTINDDEVTITAPLALVRNRIPTPAELLLLHLLAMTVMRIPAVGALIKRLLATVLITRTATSDVRNRRTIQLRPRLRIHDEQSGSLVGWTRITRARAFTSIRMASQGYWQRQDDEA